MRLSNRIIFLSLFVCMLGASVPLARATLTDAQIQAVLSVLQSFGVDAGTIASVRADLNGTPAPTACTGSWTRDLTIGSTGSDVLSLQRFLNSQGYTVAQSGSGSPGSETSYFGPATRAAVARFQAAANITPAVGYFGPLTRATASARCATLEEPPPPSAGASCSANGITIADGASGTFYSVSTLGSGSCDAYAQVRTCTNGVLSGSYAYPACSVGTGGGSGGSSCSFAGQTVSNGGSVTAYASASAPAGTSCTSQTRVCSNGTLSGSYGYGSCSSQTLTLASVDSSELTDYIMPNVCVNGADHPVPGDPGNCPSGTTSRNLKVGEEIPYVRVDWDPSRTPTQAGKLETSYPAFDGNRNQYWVYLADGEDLANGKGLGDWDAENVYGIDSWQGSTISAVESNNTTQGTNFWMTTGCQLSDSWALLPKTFRFGQNESESAMVASALTPIIANIKYSDSISTSVTGLPTDNTLLLPPLTQKSDGLYRGTTKMCDNVTGAAWPTRSTSNPTYGGQYVEYGSIPNMRYENGQVLDTIFERGYYDVPPNNPRCTDPLNPSTCSDTDSGGVQSQFEEDYFTRSYGRTRWETWATLGSLEHQGLATDVASAQALVDGTTAAHCPTTGSSTQVLHGYTFYRKSCGNENVVLPIPNTFAPLPIQPRVWHLSRQIFGANQNWVFTSDFADGSMLGWSPSANVASASIARLTPAGTKVNNAQLAVVCKSGGACSVNAARSVLDRGSDPYDSADIMTPAEQSQLTWLQGLDIGVSVFSHRTTSTTIKFTVYFTDGHGSTIATDTLTDTVAPGEAKRIQGYMPFTYAQLLASRGSMYVTAQVGSGSGAVNIDDIYVAPHNGS